MLMKQRKTLNIIKYELNFYSFELIICVYMCILKDSTRKEKNMIQVTKHKFKLCVCSICKLQQRII